MPTKEKGTNIDASQQQIHLRVWVHISHSDSHQINVNPYYLLQDPLSSFNIRRPTQPYISPPPKGRDRNVVPPLLSEEYFIIHPPSHTRVPIITGWIHNERFSRQVNRDWSPVRAVVACQLYLGAAHITNFGHYNKAPVRPQKLTNLSDIKGFESLTGLYMQKLVREFLDYQRLEGTALKLQD